MSDSQKEFMHETITKQNGRGGRIVKRFLLCAGMALLFGVVASFTFVLSRPWWEASFAEPTEPESIHIFNDVTEETGTQPATEAAEPLPEETPEETTESAAESGGTLEWKDIRPSVQAMIDGDLADLDDLNSIGAARQKLASGAAASMVTVTARRENTDWFDNVVSNHKESFGVLIGETEEELLILTADSIFGEADYADVTFYNGQKAGAELKAADNVFGIAVLSVQKEELESGTLDSIRVIPFGNSYMTEVGDTVTVVGNPLGYNKSAMFGNIVYLNASVPGTDALVRLFQTDIPMPENAGGILLNRAGEMIGWVTSKYGNYSVSGLMPAVALNDLKASVEKLSNGEKMPMLGIRGQIVTTSMAEEYELPTGIYISKCIADKPADHAGLQPGDVLILMEDQKIAAFTDLTAALSTRKAGDRIPVTVMRSGIEGYAEMEFEVTLQGR